MTAVDRFSPEYRRAHLGASQWPAAVGRSPYQAPIDLWAELVGEKEHEDIGLVGDIGNALEDGVAKIAAKRLGVDFSTSATIEHADHRWLCATPDRVRFASKETLRLRPLQIKTTARGELWGEEGTDDIPGHVIVQVQAEMFVEASAWGYAPEATDVAVLKPGHAGLEVGLYVVEWDRELAAMLFERVEKFWRAVQTKTPPEPDDSDSYHQYLSRRYPSHSEGKWVESALADALALDYIDCDNKIEELESQRKRARNQLETIIADGEGVRGAWGRLPWRAVQGRTGLQLAPLVDELRTVIGTEKADELIAKHTKRGNGYRRFGPAVLTKKETKE